MIPTTSPESPLDVPRNDEVPSHVTAGLALGRILRMASRPSLPGDVEEYERCRAIIMGEIDPVQADYRPSYVRDRLKGAQGD